MARSVATGCWSTWAVDSFSIQPGTRSCRRTHRHPATTRSRFLNSPGLRSLARGRALRCAMRCGPGSAGPFRTARCGGCCVTPAVSPAPTARAWKRCSSFSRKRGARSPGREGGGTPKRRRDSRASSRCASRSTTGHRRVSDVAAPRSTPRAPEYFGLGASTTGRRQHRADRLEHGRLGRDRLSLPERGQRLGRSDLLQCPGCMFSNEQFGIREC